MTSILSSNWPKFQIKYNDDDLETLNLKDKTGLETDYLAFHAQASVPESNDQSSLHNFLKCFRTDGFGTVHAQSLPSYVLQQMHKREEALLERILKCVLVFAVDLNAVLRFALEIDWSSCLPKGIRVLLSIPEIYARLSLKSTSRVLFAWPVRHWVISELFCNIKKGVKKSSFVSKWLSVTVSLMQMIRGKSTAMSISKILVCNSHRTSPNFSTWWPLGIRSLLQSRLTETFCFQPKLMSLQNYDFWWV